MSASFEFPRALPRPPARPPRRRRWLGAIALVAALAVGGALLARLVRGDPAPPACPRPASRVAAGAVAVVGDPSGSGCPVTVVWWPDHAEADRPEPTGRPTRFTLGHPGDQLVLGDWDGDGRDTPAVYDPERGQIVRYARWADPGETVAGTVEAAAAGGHATVARHPGGDEVVVG